MKVEQLDDSQPNNKAEEWPHSNVRQHHTQSKHKLDIFNIQTSEEVENKTENPTTSYHQAQYDWRVGAVNLSCHNKSSIVYYKGPFCLYAEFKGKRLEAQTLV